MAATVVQKPACEHSTFWRFAADACRQAIHAAHEARILKTIAEDAVETRVYEAAHRIRKHPFLATAAAFAVGVPVGILIAAAASRRREA